MLTIPTDGIQTSWLFTKRGLGFGRGLGYHETNPSDHSGPADYKSGALTTRPRRISLIFIFVAMERSQSIFLGNPSFYREVVWTCQDFRVTSIIILASHVIRTVKILKKVLDWNGVHM